MITLTYRERQAIRIENESVRVTATVEGGHIAEVLHKGTSVNPLWMPPWPSIEPTRYDPAKHAEYGGSNESQLLSGILGHNICLDTFGAPSPEEAAAGMPVHGEAPVVRYEVSAIPDGMVWPPLSQKRNCALNGGSGSRLAARSCCSPKRSRTSRPATGPSHGRSTLPSVRRFLNPAARSFGCPLHGRK